MDTDFINLTPENLSGEHLCCIIRSKKIHPGIEAKRQWLASRLTEGHVFRKLNAKATVFIEYAMSLCVPKYRGHKEVLRNKSCSCFSYSGRYVTQGKRIALCIQ